MSTGTSASVNLHLNKSEVEVSHIRHVQPKGWTLVIETIPFPTVGVALFDLTPEAVRNIRDGAQALLEAMGTDSADAPA